MYVLLFIIIKKKKIFLIFCKDKKTFKFQKMLKIEIETYF